MATYPTTDKEFVKMLETAAAQKTIYCNQYPYNLGYYHNQGYFSFDCVNLDKAILNGWQLNKTVGYFMNTLTRTGDCTEWGLLSQCEYSTNFTNMNCVAVLYMQGHIGNYIGKEVTINGYVYNAIECTAAWGGGVLYSYVDTNGGRYNHKGGARNGTWTHWGKLAKWLEYTDSDDTPVTSDEKKTVDEVAQEVIDGKWGNGTERQKKLEAAGYGYRTIQDRVNELVLNNDAATIEKVAREVIAGKYGNYPQRKTKLEAMGFNYRTIQDKVNELLV